jgi:hypothetical protein
MDHTPLSELAANLAKASRSVAVGRQYTHYKDVHRPYTVTGLVILEDSEAVAVAYHVTSNPEVTFIRPLDSWLSVVEWHGQVVPRFRPVV